jgi:hypothetical protein
MKKVITNIVLLLLLGPLLTTVWAQKRGGKGMKKQMYSRQYNVNSVETIEGEIVEVTYRPSKKKAATMGVHMTVKTKSETVPVHLGPVWYLNQQQELNKGDNVTVTGSRITYDGSPALIAAKVIRNQMTLRLRDQNGFPVWRGWRRSETN